MSKCILEYHMPCSFNVKLIIKKEHLATVLNLLESDRYLVRDESDFIYSDDEDEDECDVYTSIKKIIREMYWYDRPIYHKECTSWCNQNTINFYKDSQSGNMILKGSYTYGKPETGAGYFDDELDDFKRFVEYLKDYLEDTQIDIDCLLGNDGNHCNLHCWHEMISLKNHVYADYVVSNNEEETNNEWIPI